MKLKNRTFIGPTGLGVFLAVCLGLPATAPAAPGTLSDVPLFLATGAEPNIFFVLDDSVSMSSDVLKSRGATAAHPVVTEWEYCDANPAVCAGGANPVCDPGWDFDHDFDDDCDDREVWFDVDGNMVTAPTREDQILEHCVGYNVMAYDTTVTYTPWKDGEGNALTDRTLAMACSDPFDPFDASTCTQDIGDWVYFLWTDAGGEGDYDIG